MSSFCTGYLFSQFFGQRRAWPQVRGFLTRLDIPFLTSAKNVGLHDGHRRSLPSGSSNCIGKDIGSFIFKKNKDLISKTSNRPAFFLTSVSSVPSAAEGSPPWCSLSGTVPLKQQKIHVVFNSSEVSLFLQRVAAKTILFQRTPNEKISSSRSCKEGASRH